MIKFKAIGCLADHSPAAQHALSRLQERYPALLTVKDDIPKQIEVLVVLGGDGFMLHTLHRCVNRSLAIYGMNAGTVGFLMNEFNVENLLDRLASALPTIIHPLSMSVTDHLQRHYESLAFNEISLLRQTNQAAKISIALDNAVHLAEMVGDGVLVATPAGSSAYNLSAGGPIIPLGANLLALTPLNPFRPRRWRGALLPDSVTITITALENAKRPVSAVADFIEVRNIHTVTVKIDRTKHITLLFDRGHSLEDRILKEQFS